MTNVLDSVMDVFTQIGQWIVEAVQNLIPMFWSSEGGLTFLGVLAVAGLAFSVVFFDSIKQRLQRVTVVE